MGGGGGGMAQGGMGHGHSHSHFGGRHFGGGFGGLYSFDGPTYYSDYGSCYQRRWVPTPHGYRWRTIRICDY
jgi:hypothetical protein